MKQFYRSILIIATFLLAGSLKGQLIAIEPESASGDGEITITFDATEGTGGLIGASTVYMHSGVVTSEPGGTDWDYVVGNWGMDDGIGEMTKVSGSEDLWEISMTPRTYYEVPQGENIFRLAMVFRNANGSAEGKGTPGTYSWGTVASNGDIYVDLDVSAYVTITSPREENLFPEEGEPITMSAEASGDVSAMSLFIDGDEKTSVSSGTTISYDFTPAVSDTIELKVTATINGEVTEAIKNLVINLRPATTTADLPAGLKKGINYHTDETKATLVLEAPGKEFVYVVGDFNAWLTSADYLMNQTSDGELFWLEVTGLTPGQDYVFQYWVDGTVKIGDPYAEQVADPWNDQYIPDSLYPDLPEYTRTDYGIATVLQTAQTQYNWAASEAAWTPPAKEDLVIYELLIRDFLGSHSYQDLTDTLTYLKKLGINAIELMPVMEFEGNSSWGYNTSYQFAPDKYYGTEEDLKAFIEAAHQQGIAVILDMVLNHAFGQNAMVQMYWDAASNTVSADNPWFNPVAKHPFNVGYDFNHESPYTKALVDSVNHYWIQEYHFDGFRFDLSKGFTQTDYGDDVNAWSGYDQGRIDLLKRMAEKIRTYDQDAYVILEHFGDASEEAALSNEGMILWKGFTYFYAEALKGETADISGSKDLTHVTFMESHDEQRTAYEMITNGRASGSYDVKKEAIMLERAKMAAAFHFLQAGPKMIWQFGELGYDIDINYISRLAEKPLPWGEGNLEYYEDDLRQYVYDAYAAILELRNEYNDAIDAGIYTSSLSGDLKQLSIDHETLDICVIGNFGVQPGSVDPDFPSTGTWYDYFSGESIEVSNPNNSMELKAGEFHVYTSSQISVGFPDVVKTYQNPVTVNPSGFKVDDEIVIEFNATKASPDGTDGLIGAEKVYMQAGLVTDDPEGTDLTHIVGNLTDDGVGEMTKVEGASDKWRIVITPKEYFGLGDTEEAFRIGMYFRDAANDNMGKGFRDELIFVDIIQEGTLISVNPATFSVENEITITFNAALGNRGLVNAEKVYMHSGVVITDISEPTSDDWANVVGTWGTDDGVGKMTQIAGTSQWKITLTPEDYYSLPGDAYWLAMIFRDASGDKKGTGVSGNIEGGFIATNGDIFIRIPNRKTIVNSVDEKQNNSLLIFPNPAKDSIRLRNFGEADHCYIYDLSGKVISKLAVSHDGTVDISELTNGLYILKTAPDSFQAVRFLINK